MLIRVILQQIQAFSPCIISDQIYQIKSWVQISWKMIVEHKDVRDVD